MTIGQEIQCTVDKLAIVYKRLLKQRKDYYEPRHERPTLPPDERQRRP